MGPAALARPAGSGPAPGEGQDRPRTRSGDDRPRTRSGDDRPRTRSGDDRPRTRSGDDRPRHRSGDDPPRHRSGKDRARARPRRDGSGGGDRRRYALARYTAGAVAARTGDEMSGPALLLAGLAATGSAVTAATLLAAVTFAAAAGGPLLGTLLDRSTRPGRLLAGALAGYALALVVILLCLGRVPIGPTLAIAVLAGLLGPAVAGGWTSQLPRVVPAGRLDRANTLDAMTFNAAGLLGPVLAGGIALLAGADTAVVVSAALVALALPAALALPEAPPRSLPSAAALPTARPAVPPPRFPNRPGAAPGAPPHPSVLAELAAGFRAIAETGPLARATTASVVSCAGQGAFLACAPLLGEQVLGDATHGTLLLAVVAAAALATNALSARLRTPPRPETVLGVSTAVLAVALALMATYHPLAVVAGAVLLGAGEGPQLTALFAIRHREAPDRLRGRIFTTGASLKITGFAVGAAAAGPLASHSPAAALAAAAAVQLLAVLTLSRGSGRRNRPARTEECDHGIAVRQP
ncbi:MFS transporter [Streptomyces qinzhouensis]|uniref:MFS transporter n=2 Tax=Streptomyces qinzhouensis TaxID=2599401 RepID=A0A5B8JGK0_9ACTN|nr:MFS transporter [Streptomyces qinzhouensis]